MKRIILVLIIVFCSCKRNRKNERKEKELEFKKDQVVEYKKLNRFLLDKNLIVSGKDTVFSIDYIKFQTSELPKKINVSYNTSSGNKNSIPKVFLSKYIEPHKIDIGFPEYLPADYPESYSFKSFKEYPNFNLFTFTYDDESCCTTLYAATTKKDTIDIISIGVIGYKGGDGGWLGEKYGEWYGDYGLSNIEVSNYEDPLEEDKGIEVDTIWSEIKLSDKGVLNYIEHHKVKYLGDKQIE